VLLEESGGVLTGRLVGHRHSERGKREGLEKFLRASGFGWGETTVVVDDRSNVEIVESAWRSIAVNPELPILRRASFVLHTRDLREILEFFPEGYKWGITPQWLAVRHEAFRKAIHACAIVVPAIAAWSKPVALGLVGSVTLLFAASEVLRLLGVALPVFSIVTWRSMRSMESRGIVLGPLLFGLGIWLAIAIFSRAAATAGVLILAIGDGAASLVGKAFGRTPLQHNPLKTFEGSLALFAVAVMIAAFFVSLPWALVVGGVACLLESLPTGPADNLILPLGTAGAVAVASAMGPR
jgi:dolichol kinase